MTPHHPQNGARWWQLYQRWPSFYRSCSPELERPSLTGRILEIPKRQYSSLVYSRRRKCHWSAINFCYRTLCGNVLLCYSRSSDVHHNCFNSATRSRRKLLPTNNASQYKVQTVSMSVYLVIWCQGIYWHRKSSSGCELKLNQDCHWKP